MAENPIFAIDAQVRRLRANGADIVALTAGEPQFPTRHAIVAAAQQAIADPATHRYAPAAGTTELREAIARQLPGATPWSVDEVLVTFGAKHALALAVAAIAGNDDEVIVIAPGWPGHAAAVRAAGAAPVIAAADDKLRLPISAVEAVTTARTRAIIIASPANPTGAVLGAGTIEAQREWAIDHDAWIISDDVYGALAFAGTVPHVLDEPTLRSRTIVVDSVSKEHAMTGWRVGWLAAPTQIATYARDRLAATVTNVPAALQHAAIIALADTAGPRQARDTYRARRDRLVAALDDLPGVTCPSPDGGMFAFPHIRGILDHHGWNESAPLAARFLDHGVAVVPGEAFNAPSHIRLCFGVDDDTLDTAIARLRTAVLTDLMKPA
ncbi:pyridoxal phosphate-dependent aminotransferase [Arenivirga flava]|uniref:Aminotransferase n=1 Tax=Arenivirga flava TaxID=1930060 RepID=A0AA37ULN7_9MICO|nr:aminotransferase class I/II-fold pyridoxal phosphate-dependent enzyme [Arenivirga flava]GMA28850.1 aminotransferase [Arenivirga flava]